jgi:hypothetical protein
MQRQQHDAAGAAQRALWEPATREQRIFSVPALTLRAKACLVAIDLLGRRLLAEQSPRVVIDDGGELLLECTLDELVAESGLSRRTVQHAIDDAVRRGVLDADQQSGRPYGFWVRWRRITELAPPLAPVQPAPPLAPVQNSSCTGAESAVAPVQTGVQLRGGKGGAQSEAQCIELLSIKSDSQKLNIESAAAPPVAPVQTGVQPAPPVRPWCWTKAQLADAAYVDAVIVPAAIVRWRLPDSELTVLGLQAAAICAVTRCRDAPRCFTDFCKRRAWEVRGRGGIAEKYFEGAAALRRGTLQRIDEAERQAQAAREIDQQKAAAKAAFVREFGE